MKKTKLLAGAFLLAGVALTGCNKGTTATTVKLNNEVDSMSYALGLNLGEGFGQNLQGIPGGQVNKDILITGFIQSIKGDSAAMKLQGDEVYTVLENFFAKAAEKEKQEANLTNVKVLYEFGLKDGVQKTNSGLQYRIITEGNGPIPTKDNVVRVNYVGRLHDGTVFDSSIERGQPAEFPVGAVIPGWTEALQLMPVGSKWELAIPSELGYGERAVGSIPANSVLFFEVELLDIVTPK